SGSARKLLSQWMENEPIPTDYDVSSRIELVEPADEFNAMITESEITIIPGSQSHVTNKKKCIEHTTAPSTRQITSSASFAAPKMSTAARLSLAKHRRELIESTLRLNSHIKSVWNTASSPALKEGKSDVATAHECEEILSEARRRSKAKLEETIIQQQEKKRLEIIAKLELEAEKKKTIEKERNLAKALIKAEEMYTIKSLRRLSKSTAETRKIHDKHKERSERMHKFLENLEEQARLMLTKSDEHTTPNAKFHEMQNERMPLQDKMLNSNLPSKLVGAQNLYSIKICKRRVKEFFPTPNEAQTYVHPEAQPIEDLTATKLESGAVTIFNLEESAKTAKKSASKSAAKGKRIQSLKPSKLLEGMQAREQERALKKTQAAKAKLEREAKLREEKMAAEAAALAAEAEESQKALKEKKEKIRLLRLVSAGEDSSSN
ncbi:hypothetical protein HDU84_007822, partial [Entophlyctis sp. JEL0112]